MLHVLIIMQRSVGLLTIDSKGQHFKTRDYYIKIDLHRIGKH